MEEEFENSEKKANEQELKSVKGFPVSSNVGRKNISYSFHTMRQKGATKQLTLLIRADLQTFQDFGKKLTFIMKEQYKKLSDCTYDNLCIILFTKRYKGSLKFTK